MFVIFVECVLLLEGWVWNVCFEIFVDGVFVEICFDVNVDGVECFGGVVLLGMFNFYLYVF